MSLADRFRGIFVMDDDDYEEEEQQEEIISKEHSRSSEACDYNHPSDSARSSANKSNRVVNIHATTQLQVVLV